MNALHAGTMLRTTAVALAVASALLLGSLPVAAQDRIPFRTKTSSKPQPAAKSLLAIKAQTSLKSEGSAKSQPSQDGVSAPLGLPFEEPLRKLGILTGYYDFDDSVEGKVSGMRNPNEVAFSNRAYLQSEYHRNQDLDRDSTFVGLWTSVPIKSSVAPKPSTASTAKPTKPKP